MTLDQLKILEQIAETGSIGAAAKTLYRTQPTLSVAMKKLEEELNLSIFSRDQYRITLTPAGHSLYYKAKQVLKKAEEFEQLGQYLTTGCEAELHIAFFGELPIAPLMSVLKRCEQDYPQTKLHLSVENLLGGMERLLENEVDLAILPWKQENHSLEYKPFVKIRLMPVVSPQFPPALLSPPVPQEVIKQYVQVVLKDSSRRPSKETYGVLEGGRQWRVNDLHTKKAIILSGMGWGNLPEHIIRAELDQGLLVPLQLENYTAFVESNAFVVRRFGQPTGPVAQKLWEDFQCYAANPPD